MRKIQLVFWPNQVSNEELYRRDTGYGDGDTVQDTEMEMDQTCSVEREVPLIRTRTIFAKNSPRGKFHRFFSIFSVASFQT